MIRRLPLLTALALGLGLFLPAFAAPPAEISPGLGFLRVTSFAKSANEFTEVLQRDTSCVLDLRAAAAEPEAAAVLQALNTAPGKSRLYVLVSPDTPESIAKLLTGAPARVTLLGVKGSHPDPQVIVMQTAADDRKAGDALDQGAAPATLISGKIEKERFDEAELVKEFKNGNHDAHPPEIDATGKSTEARLVDRVLQRAVHLHRALQALQRP